MHFNHQVRNYIPFLPSSSYSSLCEMMMIIIIFCLEFPNCGPLSELKVKIVFIARRQNVGWMDH